MPRTPVTLLLVLVALAGRPTLAAAQADEPPSVIVSIYQVAPGQIEGFLEWMAAGEAIASEVGAPGTDWYMHMNGDQWDFVTIAAPTTAEQDEAIEELRRERGLETGAAAAFKFREYVAWHTDTEAVGPLSPADILEATEGGM